MTLSPDDWTVKASSLPIAFAQVREDPQLDLELCKSLPAGSTVVMIASGGETAIRLGRLPLRLHLVDMNPAQLVLSRLKWKLASLGDPLHAQAILGHLPLDPDVRSAELIQLLGELAAGKDILGPLDLVSSLGPDHVGRYERVFAELRTRLAPWQQPLLELLSRGAPVPGLGGTLIGEAMEQAFTEVMALPNLVCLFGEEATRNPRQSFSDHFIGRTYAAFRRTVPRENPFLWQILAGRFNGGFTYDWLRPDEGADAPLTSQVEWHHGKMIEVLEGMAPDSADLVHLSNILDWLSPEEGLLTLERARRVLRTGGRVMIRQLNSTLDIAAIDAGFEWDESLGRSMEERDRSFFYPGIFVGVKG